MQTEHNIAAHARLRYSEVAIDVAAGTDGGNTRTLVVVGSGARGDVARCSCVGGARGG